jgi:hypothetical protein
MIIHELRLGRPQRGRWVVRWDGGMVHVLFEKDEPLLYLCRLSVVEDMSTKSARFLLLSWSLHFIISRYQFGERTQIWRTPPKYRQMWIQSNSITIQSLYPINQIHISMNKKV